MEVSRLPSCVALHFTREELECLIDKARDWALMHGMSFRPRESFNKNQVQVLPFTLLPSTFPKEHFHKVKRIQVVLNELTHNVAHNHSFITKSLESTIAADSFTAKLFNIYETVHKEGYSQTISIGVLRSDYMLHEDQIKQVELNTIASSFGGISSVTTECHKYVLLELGDSDKVTYLPRNEPNKAICEGLTHAWKLYNNEKSVILFVVETITYNICDQRFLEYEIRKRNPYLKLIRRSLTDLVSEAKLGSNKELIIGDEEVGLVYFRSGYEVEAYPTEQEWSVRLLIERSRAIKCPSIQYHLAGTKKVQQSLTNSNDLKKFLKEKAIINQLEQIFGRLYSLEFNEEAETIIDKAISEPTKYVLKPQREGGGNNLYNEEMKQRLKAMRSSKERTAWILMERFYPPVQENYIVRAQNEPFENDNRFIDVVSELGIYGVIIGDHENIIYNKEIGHILRTKQCNENEGGIAAGIGAVDGPFLI
ncbi:glutathione synthetase-like [Hylaeus anthracinus]|uniref:glutathione synthetase-like n=1 Tax=Hylaeus anthracinus TaxID=313031 RepID=UPI0023BA3840|nr:glutathione synthetase-like [Hylaeus anthracinus]